jgi:hypothetical protein
MRGSGIEYQSERERLTELREELSSVPPAPTPDLESSTPMPDSEALSEEETS